MSPNFLNVFSIGPKPLMTERELTWYIYLDFRKAFDTVPHRSLVYKLKHLGVRGHVLAWIEIFLRGRRQRVVLRNGSSTWNEVTSGVPQGSILGPLLFLFYVNDIPDIVSSTAKMFADDTKVYRKISSKAGCDSLQSDLNELAAWSTRWLLEFNAEKCVVLRIRAALNYQYSLNGVYLQEVTSQKDLGITISNSLNQTKHVQELVKKANQKIAMFRRCFTGLDEAKVTIHSTNLSSGRRWSSRLRPGVLTQRNILRH